MDNKILIVDDEAFSRTAIVESIKNSDYTIDIFMASNGDEALEILKKNNIDVLMTDIKMPGMSGMELLEKVRGLEINIEVIILSSFNEFNLVRQALQLGAFDYLFKPTMLPEDIMEVVNKAFERKKKNQAELATGKKQENIQPKEREMFFSDLINGRKISENEFQDQLLMHQLPKDIKKIVVIVLRLKLYQESLVEIFENNINLLKDSVNKYICELKGQASDNQLLSNNFYEYILISWSRNADNEKEFLENIENIIRQITDFLSKNYRLEFTVGISNIGKSFDEVSKLYIEATYESAKGDLNYGKINYANEFKGNTALNKEMKIALDYIKNKLGNKNLSLKMVAEHVGLSRNYFCKIFKQAMGENFNDYITKLRVEKARNLYMNTDMKIYEIAELVGYSDWHYLYSVYKKILGHSMSQEK